MERGKEGPREGEKERGRNKRKLDEGKDELQERKGDRKEGDSAVFHWPL